MKTEWTYVYSQNIVQSFNILELYLDYWYKIDDLIGFVSAFLQVNQGSVLQSMLNLLKIKKLFFIVPINLQTKENVGEKIEGKGVHLLITRLCAFNPDKTDSNLLI